MGFKPASIFLDTTSGYFDQAIYEQTGDTNKGDWGLKYGPMMGGWRRDITTLTQISQKYGTIVGVGSHLELEYVRSTVGRDQEGKPIKDKEPINWKLAIPGEGQEKLLAPFDEVYHLVTVDNEVGTNPVRKLHTYPHVQSGYRFKAKTRKGVKGPITNPDYAKIIAALPVGADKPLMFLVAGVPGAGKTTLFRTFPGPKLFIDLQGGCAEAAKDPDTIVRIPAKLEDVFVMLRQIRDSGELKT